MAFEKCTFPKKKKPKSKSTLASKATLVAFIIPSTSTIKYKPIRWGKKFQVESDISATNTDKI